MTEPGRLTELDELFQDWYGKYLEISQYTPVSVDAMSIERGGEAAFPQLDITALREAKRREQDAWEKLMRAVEESGK